MGLFKGLDEKPYTKADFYREMEERAAAKRAAKAAPVIVVPVKEPEWLEPENVAATELATNITEEVVIPFTEPSVAEIETDSEQKVETVAKSIDDEPSDFTSAAPKEDVKKVAKNKRKKSG